MTTPTQVATGPSKQPTVLAKMSESLKGAVAAVQQAATDPAAYAKLSLTLANENLKLAGKDTSPTGRGQFARQAALALASWEAAKIKADAPAAKAAAIQIKSAAIVFNARLAAAQTGAAIQNRDSALSKVRAKVFRARTGTQFVYDSTTESPTFIEVVQMPQSTDNKNLATIDATGFKYNDFFITDTQEADAEKADVSETFGAPHVFATGRYMRKLTISGVCRTGPVNKHAMDPALLLSEATALPLIVPQSVGLRVLYDRMLRASEQISRGLYSRLHVDGEVYCGWFTTLNISRSGNDESFAHFTSSMLVFQRYHPREEDARKLLVPSTLPPRQAFNDTVAIATLAALAGTMTVTFKGASGTVKGKVTESASSSLIFDSASSVVFGGTPQRLVVTYNVNQQPVQGFSLQYGTTANSRTAFEDAQPPIGTFSLYPAVTDFNSFIESLKAAGIDTKNPVTITVTARPAFGETTATFTVTLAVDATRTPKVEQVEVALDEAFANVKTMPATFKPSEFFTSNYLSNKLYIQLRLKTPAGVALPADVLTSVSAIPYDPEVEKHSAAAAKVAATTGTTPSTMEIDKTKVAKPNMATIFTHPFQQVGDPADGIIRTYVEIDCGALSDASGGADLRTTNPFAGANELSLSFRLRLAFASDSGYSPILLPTVFKFVAKYEKVWPYLMLSSISSITRIPDTFDPFDRDRNASSTIRVSLSPNKQLSMLPATPQEVVDTVLVIIKGSTYVVDGTSISLSDKTPRAEVNETYVDITIHYGASKPKTVELRIPPEFGVIPMWQPPTT